MWFDQHVSSMDYSDFEEGGGFLHDKDGSSLTFVGVWSLELRMGISDCMIFKAAIFIQLFSNVLLSG